MLIPDSKIQEVRERVDMIALVQRHGVDLKKSGRSYKGLCPFHSDKSPSLSVNPDKGVWHCFGCGASGNVETFLERINPVNGTARAKILNAAADHYARTLEKHPKAIEYLKGRGLALPWLIES